MVTTETGREYDPHYNPYLLIIGVLVIAGGLLFSSLIVFLWMLWVWA